MPILDDLRKRAKASKLSQRELSRRSGVHHVTLSRFLSGDTGISVESAEKLARSLGYTLKLTPKPK